MGLPAMDMRRKGAPVRPRLRVVRHGKPAARRPSNSARTEQHCREVFNIACIIMLGLTLFGLGRVMLSARAAETAMESGRIARDIKAQRLEGDLLEVDKSSLATPSRIEGIAGQTLKMASAPEVDYMTLPVSAAESKTQPPAGDASSGAVSSAGIVRQEQAGGLAGMLASVMEMATGEAELLLVGDAGLASAR